MPKVSNVELVKAKREFVNALNRASYAKRKAAGTNKQIKPVDKQKKRGRKNKEVTDNDVKILKAKPLTKDMQQRIYWNKLQA